MQAPPCATFWSHKLCTMQSSSATLGRCCHNSLIGMPLFPVGRNFHGDASRLPRLAKVTRVRGKDGCLPSFFCNNGFGSNRSTCEGPPCMKRKITRLARGAKCGLRGASGPSASARAELVLSSRWDNARPPKPTHQDWRRLRLETAFGCVKDANGAAVVVLMDLTGASMDINELTRQE